MSRSARVVRVAAALCLAVGTLACEQYKRAFWDEGREVMWTDGKSVVDLACQGQVPTNALDVTDAQVKGDWARFFVSVPAPICDKKTDLRISSASVRVKTAGSKIEGPVNTKIVSDAKGRTICECGFVLTPATAGAIRRGEPFEFTVMVEACCGTIAGSWIGHAFPRARARAKR